MSFIIENWYMVIVALAVLTLIGGAVYTFFKKSSEKQLAKVREWLLFATLEAEKALGTGTGAVKLRYVYDLFITRFKWLSYVISFEAFSSLVDDALSEMRAILAINKDVKNLIEKGD